MHGAILDGRLVGQVVHRLDGHLHPLHRQESRQVGGVRGDDDQGEGPPLDRERDLRLSLVNGRRCGPKLILYHGIIECLIVIGR